MPAMKQPKMWLSRPPDKCEIEGEVITDVFIDGATIMGPWACMCPSCHNRFGKGLGLGLGQRYEKQGDQWVKVEG